jgi:Leucine-rich repeat (LRR) protein
LHGNQISEALPECLGYLKKLKHLDIGDNILVRDIPGTFDRLTHLETLSLHGNRMHASIRQNLFRNMQVVREFAAPPLCLGMRLTDHPPLTPPPLPPHPPPPQSLRVLHLSGNAFHGSLPASLAAATSLREVLLDSNAFEGGLPAGLAALTALSVLSVRGNQLAVVPEPAALARSLRSLALSGNRLRGPLPGDGWPQALPQLRTLDCSHNRLTGGLPRSLLSLSALVSLNLADNEMTGPIPPLGEAEALEALLLFGNAFSGQVPWESMRGLGRLAELNLAGNRLTGQWQLPSVAGALPGLRQAHLQGNLFAGGEGTGQQEDVDSSAGEEVDNIEEDEERPWLREEKLANQRRPPPHGQPRIEL